jgi:hypothetical protein
MPFDELIYLVVEIDSIFFEQSQVRLYRSKAPVPSDPSDRRGRLG